MTVGGRKPWARFAGDEGPSLREFVGALCVIRTGWVDVRFGQAEVRAADGSTALVQVRQYEGEELALGSTGLLYAYEEDQGFFWVTPFDPGLDPAPPEPGRSTPPAPTVRGDAGPARARTRTRPPTRPGRVPPGTHHRPRTTPPSTPRHVPPSTPRPTARPPRHPTPHSSAYPRIGALIRSRPGGHS
ncbi:hypothetical protein [Streptomyces sp. SolWspMP-sol7th]